VRNKPVIAVCAGLLATLTWATISLQAQDPKKLPPNAVPAKTDSPPAPHNPGDVILEQSRVYIFVGKTGFGHEHAVVGKLKSGSIVLGRAERAGGLIFDMTSFDADSAEARKYIGLQGETDKDTRQQVNANMRSKDVLDTANFPTALLKIDATKELQPAPGPQAARYELTGSFVLHGVKKPLKLMCEVTNEKNGYRVKTVFTIKQTDYGITPFSKALGTVGVTDELKIYGDVLIAPNPQ